ncbi:DNA replication and repair protein RecF [Dictyobacter vulcani]|uniref:DNA replication and repair protein RecF n=1 Tax=Dictyobacter vulcani TaxID=2607529 RepID=A0A5J4KKA4_9CHLR|nr:DNA replication/repair protein RecF [Dictyobacter vulcani]GER87462.1 DNA replication and repair protein RecF [Dictyobacter vulcani]
MYLSRLFLSDFRNYKELELSLGPGLFLFYGDNAQGKTNLLEAVSMLATATSFHASSDREVVNWSAQDHVARLDGTVQRLEDKIQLEVLIVDPSPPVFAAAAGVRVNPRSIELPAHAPRKRYKVNGVPKRTIDLIGQLKVVLFAPSDLHLVDGGPEERRRFLDRALCQVQPRYSVALVKYRKIVTQRSALLKRIRDNQEDPGMLNYLDEQLTQLANQIIYERRRMIDALNDRANEFQRAISGGREQLQIVYRPSFQVDGDWGLTEAAEHYREQLRDARKKEIHQGVCLRGPHRDDLEFLVNGVNMLSYGSRGQQRTAALSAKLAELAFMHSSTGDQPILLLDDVFSELDASRREYLLCQVAGYEQVMLTSTDLEGFPADMVQRAHRYQVSGGVLKSE